MSFKNCGLKAILKSLVFFCNYAWTQNKENWEAMALKKAFSGLNCLDSHAVGFHLPNRDTPAYCSPQCKGSLALFTGSTLHRGGRFFLDLVYDFVGERSWYKGGIICGCWIHAPWDEP